MQEDPLLLQNPTPEHVGVEQEDRRRCRGGRGPSSFLVHAATKVILGELVILFLVQWNLPTHIRGFTLAGECL